MKKFEDLVGVLDYVSYEKNNSYPINYISNNSKEIEDRDVFVAVRGNLADGHDYIDPAIAKGARVIIHEEDIAYRQGISYIRVKDARLALSQASSFLSGYPSKDLRLVAVTGSNGKTTTSRLIAHLCGEIFGKSGSIGTNKAFVGGEEIETSNTTPDIYKINKILQKAKDEGIETMALEASSHGLSQRRLDGLDIDYGIFTNLSEEHLDYHKNMENYFRAKMILFDKARVTLANIDDPYGKRAKDLYPSTISFGIDNPDADFRASDLIKKDGKISFKVKGREIILNTIADFEVYNTLAAIACLATMGASMDEIIRGLSTFKGLKSRFEYIKNDLGLNIIIDFAHTPRAFEAIFASIPKKASTYAVFGINGDRNKDFRRLIGEVTAKAKVFAILTTDDPKFDQVSRINADIIEGIKAYGGDFVIREDRKEAMAYALGKAKKGDYVLLLGKGEEQFIKLKGNEKTPYSERETLLGVLESL